MQISRRTVLGSTTAAAQSTTARPPTIVFPISDDHTAAGLGCCGNTHVRRIGNSSLKTLFSYKRLSRSGQVQPCTTSTPATAEWQPITFVSYFEKLEPRNTRKLHIVFNPASAALNIQCALRATGPRLPKLRRVCHYCSADLPTQCLIKLQLWDWLCMRMHTRISHQPIVHGFWSNQLLCIRLHRW